MGVNSTFGEKYDPAHIELQSQELVRMLLRVSALKEDSFHGVGKLCISFLR